MVLVSDIRVDPSEHAIRRDMELQKEWVRLTRPKHSMLKFRLSWDMDEYSNLDGEVRLQPFTPQRSTETRLLVDRRGVSHPGCSLNGTC